MSNSGEGFLADLFPARGVSALVVLDEQVGGPDLALGHGDVLGLDVAGGGAVAVEVGHVDLELLGVGALGGFPAGNGFFGVEVVGEVFAVAVADFPVGRETGLGLFFKEKHTHTRLAT